MKQSAKVLKNNGDKALVKINRQSACQQCHRECLLAGNEHEMKEIEVEVDNPARAKAGQTVNLEMGEGHLIIASLIVYILPLIGLITGYFAGSWIGPYFFSITANISGILGAFVFFFLVFILIRKIDISLETNKNFHPRITEIIE